MSDLFFPIDFTLFDAAYADIPASIDNFCWGLDKFVLYNGFTFFIMNYLSTTDKKMKRLKAWILFLSVIMLLDSMIFAVMDAAKNHLKEIGKFHKRDIC
jgi:hypothetical protein